MKAAAVPPASVASKILEILGASPEPMTVDQICVAAYGRLGHRERNTVHQNIFRLDEKGRIDKFPIRYCLRRT